MRMIALRLLLECDTPKSHYVRHMTCEATQRAYPKPQSTHILAGGSPSGVPTWHRTRMNSATGIHSIDLDLRSWRGSKLWGWLRDHTSWKFSRSAGFTI